MERKKTQLCTCPEFRFRRQDQEVPGCMTGRGHSTVTGQPADSKPPCLQFQSTHHQSLSKDFSTVEVRQAEQRSEVPERDLGGVTEVAAGDITEADWRGPKKKELQPPKDSGCQQHGWAGDVGLRRVPQTVDARPFPADDPELRRDSL